MRGFRSAVAFLTILPVGSDRTGMALARGWFPVIGLLIGAWAATVDLLVRSVSSGVSTSPANVSPTIHILAATVTVVTLVITTGGLHLDGLMDTCDALLGGTDPDHRRRILRDPHVGAFGVVGVTCLLLVKVAAISALPWEARAWILLLVPCLSRGVMLMTMEVFPYVGDGLGAEFLRRRGRGPVVFGLAFAAVASIALVGLWGLGILALAVVVGWLIGTGATKLLGGVTGDVYGAVNETVEVTILAAAALVLARWPSTLTSPLLAF